jgi:transglutaminase-like putative cysteine protease
MKIHRKTGSDLSRARVSATVTRVTEPPFKKIDVNARRGRDLLKMTMTKFKGADFMGQCYRVFGFVSLLVLAGPAFAERPYTPEVTVVKSINTHDVRADGSDREIIDVVYRIETAQGVSDQGAQRISYRNGIDEVESIEASTIKADGTEIKVPESAIRTQDEDSDGGATEFSDTKYKVIVFPAVEVGGRVRYRATINHLTTPFPKFFDDAHVFSPQWKWEYTEVNINVPTNMPLYVQQRGVNGGLVSTKDGVNHYQFVYRGPEPKAPESGSVWVGDYAPMFYVSTFPDMVAVGKAYETAAAPMAQITDRIKTRANEVTQGLTGDAEKVKVIDHWVAKNIRYVAVTLGHGGLIPHPADQVLANRYGDCKDHAILMQALLAAVGIESSGALVNSGGAYSLSTVGSIGPPNHIITYVPSLDLYVDSTDQFSPYGTLSFDVIDKPTVLTALGKVGRTPSMRADANVERASIEMVIHADGTIQGNTSTSVSGVWEAESRAERFYAQPTPENQVVKAMLYRFNETGTGSLEFGDPTVLEQPFLLTSTFLLDPVTNFPGPGALMIPVGLSPGLIANVGKYKPLDDVKWPYPCRSRILEDSYRIEFPENAVLGQLPNGVDYMTAGTRYQSSYERRGQSVLVHRELHVQRAGSVCTPADNEAWKTFHAVLQRDLRAQVFYQ